MLVRVGCQFEYEATEVTPSLWQVRPHPDGAHRVVTAAWEPPAPVRTYLDAYGNVCDRLILPEGASVLRYDALAEVPASHDAADPSVGGSSRQ